jgi:hypothetical protein
MKLAYILPALTLSLCVSAVRADDQADLKALVAKAVMAHGGAENLSKYPGGSSRFKGKLTIQGQAFDYTLSLNVQEPDKLRSDMEVEIMGQKLTILHIINGDKDWFKFNGTDMEATNEQKEQGRETIANSRLLRLLPLRNTDYTLSPLGEIKVDGKPAVGIRAEKKGFTPVNLYFDKTTGLLVKSEMQLQDPNNPTEKANGETFYSDYRKVEGVMIPFKFVRTINNKPFLESEVTEVKLSPKLDDNLFNKP